MIIEITLIETGIFVARLDELNGVVFQVEIDLHVTDPVLLRAWLGHRLLEITVEAEHLFVERHPGGKVEAVSSRYGAMRCWHFLTRKPLAANARLWLADHQSYVFFLVEMVWLVKLGLSHLYIGKWNSIASCKQSIHAIRIIRSHAECVHSIYRAAVVAKARSPLIRFAVDCCGFVIQQIHDRLKQVEFELKRVMGF